MRSSISRARGSLEIAISWRTAARAGSSWPSFINCRAFWRPGLSGCSAGAARLRPGRSACRGGGRGSRWTGERLGHLGGLGERLLGVRLAAGGVERPGEPLPGVGVARVVGRRLLVERHRLGGVAAVHQERAVLHGDPRRRARIADRVGRRGGRELVGQRLEGGGGGGGVAGLALGAGEEQHERRAPGRLAVDQLDRLGRLAGEPAPPRPASAAPRGPCPAGCLASSGLSRATAPGPSFFSTSALPCSRRMAGSVSGQAGEELERVVAPLELHGEVGRHQPRVEVRGVAQRPGAEHRVGLHHVPLPRRQQAELARRRRIGLLEHRAGEVDPPRVHVRPAITAARPAL